MKENLNKRVKSIAIVAAIIMGVVALAFGVSKFILSHQAQDEALNFNEYRVQANEISFSPSDEFTGEEVTVTISPSILEAANSGKTGNDLMKVQYQVTELNSETGVVESNWVDYTGPFSVDHNAKVNTRLVTQGNTNSTLDMDFTGPVTSKDITNIAVAKIGTTTYKTLAEAITAWNEMSSAEQQGKKIEMVANTSENIIIPQGKNVTIDLSGYNINGKTAQTPVITVNGTLNIIDSGKTNQGSKTYGSVTSSDSTAVTVASTGTLTLGTNEQVVNTNGPAINGGTGSNGVVVEENGTLNFYDGKITAPSGANHTAIVVNNTPVGEEDINKLTTPEGYRLSIEIDSVSGREIATLVKTLTVHFDSNGGTPSDIADIEVATGKSYGKYATWPADPTKEGYIFAGWKNNQATITSSTEVTENTNHTLTADWTAITYTIAYNANTGTGTIVNATATYNATTTLANAEAGITKPGYTLKGWSTDSNATEPTYTPGQIVTNLTTTNNDTVTLYAIWKDETAPTDTLPTGTSTTNTITVNCEQTDEGSGIDNSTIQYSIYKDGAWTDWQNTPTFDNLTANTDYQVKTRAKDNDGNGYTESEIATIKTQQIQNATTTIHKDTATGEVITAQTGMINNDTVVITVEPSTTGGTTTITVTAPDGTKTTYVLGTDVALDQDGTYHITIPNTTTGTYTIKTETTDNTNTATNTVTFQIDRTNPTINETVTTTTNSITAAANAQDAYSGVSTVTYELLEQDGTTQAQDANNQPVASNTTGEFTGLKDNHNYKVKITVTDNAGNEETKIVDVNTQELVVGTLTFKEASEATNFTPNTSDPNAQGASVSKIWKNDDVEVTIATPGNGTSTTYTYQKVGGTESAATSATSTITTENGDYVVTVTTTDGSNTKSQSYYFSIDKTAPTVAMAPNSGDVEMTQGASLGTVASTLTITEDANASGIATARWAISNDNVNAPTSGWTQATPSAENTIEVSASKSAGTYYIWAEVTDNAGNVSTTVKTSGAFNVKYVVEFDININKAAIEVIDAATIKTTESTITLANAPTREGYIFKGWVLNENETDASNALTAGTSYEVSSSTRFYAMWSEVVASTTINETTTYFDSVQGAINYANNNAATVTLIKSTISENVTIAAGQNITLNTNGKTLTSAGTTVTNSGLLTIQGNGTITSTSASSETIANTGTLTITEGTITSEGNKAITNASAGTVAISGGTITSSTTAIENNGAMNITAGQITGTNIAVENKASGTVNVSGTANISGAKAITNADNTTTNAQVTITAGTVAGTDYALYNEGNGKFTIGTNDSTVSTSLPEIVGTNYAYYATDTSEGTLEFFDGILKGETSAIRTGTNSAETVIPTGYKIVNGTDGDYETAYLANQYTVTFNPGQGATVMPTSKTVTYGEEYGVLPTPEKTGYTFANWKLNDTTITATSTVTTASDHTLTANYTPTPYAITYSNLNGGSYVTGTPQPTSYTIEQAVTLPTLEKTGYTFLGWKEVGAEDNTAVTEITTGNTGDKVLEAVFENGTSGYTLTYYLEKPDGTGYDSYSTGFETATTGDVITASAKAIAIENSTYEKATNGAGNQVTTVTVAPDGSTVLNIYYTRNTFALTVTAGTNTANAAGSGTYRWGEEVTISAEYANIAGYEYSNFAWTTTDTSILASTAETETTLTMPAAATTVTATADASTIEYTITYNLDGGSVSTENPTTYTVESANITLNNPTKTGYTFDGWTGSNGATPESTVTIAQGSTGNKQYAANWTVNTHTLTYDYGTNGGQVSSSDNTTSTTEDKNYGTNIDLTKSAYKENNAFLGWAETAEATTALATSETLTMPDSDKTLYAIYANMEVSENTVEIDLSDAEHLTKTITVSGNNYGTASVTSSDSNTATASIEGNTITITAVQTGTATVTVTSSQTDINGDSITKIITVNVIKTPIEISVLPAETVLGVDQNNLATLQATITPTGTTSYNTITWTSSNPEVATVDQSGNVTAVAEGTTTITAATGRNNTVTADATIIVDNTAPTVTITRQDYDTFTWTATDTNNVVAYSITNTNNSIPSSWQSSGITNGIASGSMDITDVGTYYVWAKDVVGNVGVTSIDAYTVRRNDAYGTTLITKADATNAEDGTNFTRTYTTVLSGTPIYVSATASETGYMAVIRKGETVIESGTITTITENSVISTTSEPIQYNITYDLSEGGMPGASAPTTGTYNKIVTIDAPTREGYTFIGWTSSQADGLSTTAKCPNAPWKGDLSTSTQYRDLCDVANGTVKLTANWKTNQYTISYNLNGGTHGTNHPEKATYNQWVNINNPTKEGYVFAGWTSSATDGLYGDARYGVPSYSYRWTGAAVTDEYFYNLANESTSEVEQIVTLTANWKTNQYTISYNLNGGTYGTNHPEKATYNQWVNINNPTKEGYEFAGWTSSAADGLYGEARYGNQGWSSWWSGAAVTYEYFYNLANESTSEVEQIVTITATWTANTYNINYSLNGGTLAENTPTTGEYNEEITVSAPTKAGYTFTGWTATGLGNEAKYNSNSWNGETQTGTENNTFTNLTSVNHGTVTLIAHWIPNSYTITYELNGGTAGAAPTTAPYDQYVTISNPTKTGYEFLGWTSSAADGLNSNAVQGDIYWDGTATKNTEFENLAPRANQDEEMKSVKLTATWRLSAYAITYELNGGTAGEQAPATAPYDQYVTISNPTKTGYEFLGWTSSAADGLNSNAVQGDFYWDGTATKNTKFKNLAPRANQDEEMKSVKLTATWRLSAYAITYELNGGTAGAEAPATAPYDQYVTISNPTKTGYEFLGWTSNATDGLNSNAIQGDIYWDGTATKNTKFKNLAPRANAGEEMKSVKLTATWTPNTYTIAYNLNGGTAGAKAPTSATYGSDVEIDNPTKENYGFTGWTATDLAADAKTGTSANPSTAWDGSLTTNTFFKNLKTSGTITLTANWVQYYYLEVTPAGMPVRGSQTLSEAFENATSGNTIKPIFSAASKSEAAAELPAGKTATLDLNGKTIEMSGELNNKGILTICGNGTISASSSSTITNTASSAELTINGATINCSSANKYGIHSNSGSVTITNATINAAYRCVRNSGTATLSISGGTFTATGVSENTYSTQTLSVAGGTVNVTGGTFTSNYGTSSKAVIGELENNTTSNVTISGGTFTGPVGFTLNGAGTLNIGGTANITATSGKAISIASTVNVNISGGTIKSSGDNTIDNSGAGSVTISGGTIKNTGSSYAVNNNSGSLIISDEADIQSNTNICVYNGASGTIQMTGGSITSSRSVGLYNAGGTTTVSGGTIETTEEKNGSGANPNALANNSGTTNISGGLLRSAYAAGLSVSNGTVTITDGTIEGKTFGIWCHATNTPTVIIGTEGGTVSNVSPSIISTDGEGLHIGAATVKFYDGIIYAPTIEQTINGTITNVPTSYQVVHGTATFENTTYKTAYLGTETVFDFNTANNMNKWDYIYPERFSTIYNSSTRMNDISITGSGGFEVISIPIQTEAGKTYKIAFDCNNKIAYTGLNYQGIQHEGITYQVLNAAPTDSINFDKSIQYAYLPTQVTQGRYELEFEATGTTTYLAFNFGTASDNKPINIELGNFAITEQLSQEAQLGTLPNLTVAETTFNGWYTAKTGGTAVTSTTTVGTNPGTYYAQITQNNNYQNTRTNEYYATMQEAFRCAASGDTVRVINGITENVKAVNPSGKTLTLETTSGKTTTFNGISLLNYGTLTISGAGNITTSSAINLIVNSTSATLNITNTGTISNTNTGSYIVISNSGTVNKTGAGTVSSTTKAYAIKGGTINVSAGNVSTTSGQAIMTNNGSISITGGIISSTSSCAVYIGGSGTLTVNESSGNITRIEKSGNISGATVQTAGSATANVLGGTIETVTGGSGAINHNSSGNLTINGATVRQSGSGNAIKKDGTGNVEIDSGTITASGAETVYNNNASGTITISGGTISGGTGNNAVVNVKSGTIEISGGNISTTSADAVANNSTGTIKISGGTIQQTGSTTKSAVAMANGTINISNGTITSDGIGVFTNNGTVTITGGTVEGALRGAHVKGTGNLVLGTKDGNVSTTAPQISASSTGTGVWAEAGSFKFYDGVIIGATRSSVVGTVADTPTGYTVRKSTANNVETATLDNHYNVRYLSGNLLYGLNDCGTTAGISNASAPNTSYMNYSISNGVVTVTAKRDDGYGMTTGRVYLEANKTYRFSCNTNGTWGVNGADTVEACLMKDGLNSKYYRMGSTDGYEFTPDTSGTYWLRLDVNQSGKTYTFSNISVYEIVDTQSKTYGSTYATFPTVSRTGYTSQGWAMENLFDRNATPAAASTYIKNDGTTASSGEYSLYQVNIEPNTAYTIINLGSSTAPGYAIYNSSGEKLSAYNYANRAAVTFTTPVDAAYIKFSVVTLSTSGRYDKDTFYLGKVVNNSSTIDITEDHDIYALWTPNKYTITLNNQSATSAGTTTIYEKYNYGYYTNTTLTTKMTTSANKITVPTKTGYTFGGYYTETNGNGTQYINANGYITSSASATNFTAAGTLYAKWTINSYNITLNPNGGKYDGSTSNKTVSATYTQDVNIGYPIREGYTFTGWQTSDGTIYDRNLLTNAQSMTGLVATSYATNALGGWRSASGGTGNRTVIDVNDPPVPGITKGFSITRKSGSVDISQDIIPVTSGNKYTISVWAKGTGTLRLQAGQSSYESKTFTMSNVTSWKKYSWTFTAGTDGSVSSSGTTNVYFGNGGGTSAIEICGMKLEEDTGFSDLLWSKVPSTTTAPTLIAQWKATKYGEYNSGNWVRGYQTLADATAGATSNNTIKALVSPITETTAATIASGKNLTLDLNKKEITFTSNSITNNGTFTVTDSGGTSGGTLNSTSGQTTINNKSKFYMQGGTISNKSNDVITTSGSSTIEVSGGIISTSASNKSGINSSSTGNINITGGNITSTSGITVINNAAGTTEINGGTITSSTNNAAKNNSTGTLKINGGTLTSTNGDAVACRSTGTVIMTDGTVTSSTKAGFSVQQNANVQITGGTVTGATYGVWLDNTQDTTPTLTLGSSDAPVTSYEPTANTTDEPIIKATNTNGIGVYVKGRIFRFYDGAVIGGYTNNTGYSIKTESDGTTPASIYIPTGYELVKLTDTTAGTETAILLPTGTHYIELDSNGTLKGSYTTLNAAFRGMTSGNTIKVLSDVTEEEHATNSPNQAYASKDITLDTNGKTITMKNSYIECYGPTSTFTIKGGGTIQGTGKWSWPAESYGPAGTVILGWGNINIENVTINSVNRVAVATRPSRYSGYNGTITIDNSTINSTGQYGVWMKNGSLNVISGSISGGDCGIYFYLDGTITLGTKGDGVSQEYPHVVGNGSGGIIVNSGQTLTVKYYDGKIQGRGRAISSTAAYGDVETGYRMYTRSEDGYYTTTLVAKANTLNAVPKLNVSSLLRKAASNIASVENVSDSQNSDQETISNTKNEEAEDSQDNKVIETAQENAEQKPQVVQINDTTYSTISEAIASANIGETIKILEDMSLSEEVIIETDKNIILDLNGKTITSTSSNTINNEGTLTITGNGIIKNEVENGVVIYNTGILNIENGVITTAANGGKAISNFGDGSNYSNGSANNVEEKGIINIKGGKVVTEGIGAIGIYNVNKSHAVITGGIFETRGYAGKAIYNDAKLEVEKAKIVVAEDDSIGIYNAENAKLCLIKDTEITIEAEQIENYELIKNTDQFKEELEQKKPSYGIYNNSKTDVVLESGTIKVERLKGVGIMNEIEGSITLGKNDDELNTSSPIIYAISDNTTAIVNSDNEKGEIKFYDGKTITIQSIKNIFTSLLDKHHVFEEIVGNNVAGYLVEDESNSGDGSNSSIDNKENVEEEEVKQNSVEEEQNSEEELKSEEKIEQTDPETDEESSNEESSVDK